MPKNASQNSTNKGQMTRTISRSGLEQLTKLDWSLFLTRTISQRGLEQLTITRTIGQTGLEQLAKLD